MALRDRRGLEVTSESAVAVEALDAATDSYLGFRADAAQHVNAALKADPGCVMANVLKGDLTMLLSHHGYLGAVDQRIAAAEPHAATATPRERLHLEALRAWRAGRNDRAIAAWEQILAEHPRDVTALRLAHFSYFWTQGDAPGMRRSVERASRGWDGSVPGWSCVLGMRAFAEEQTGDLLAAERSGRGAVALDPADLWAVHAVAHALETAGRAEDGEEWVDSCARHLEGATNFRFHLAWHRALFLLQQGARDELLETYDRTVRPLDSPLVEAQADLYIDVQNAASLLLRLELLGVDVGERWNELADKAEKRHGDALIEGLERHAARSGASEADMVARVAIPACESVRAHRRSRWGAALDALFPVRGEIVRLGGSPPQRDILWQVMADAAVRAGRHEAAATLLAEAAATRPSVAPPPPFWSRLAARLG
jgi:tetratricopeptide (TPR) repeat protein